MQWIVGKTFEYGLRYLNWTNRGIDARVYALLRISFAVVSLINISTLWSQRYELFSSNGYIDFAAAQTKGVQSLFWTLNSEAWVSIIMIVGFLAVLCFGLGFFTKVSGVIAQTWQISYMAVLIHATSAYDSVISNLGFLLLVSPCSSVWSIDSWWKNRKASRKADGQPVLVPQYGLILIKVQVAILYLYTFWDKVQDEFWRNGELISYFFFSVFSLIHDPIFADQKLLYLTGFLTWATLAIELSVPFLLLQKKYRLLGFILGYGLHGAILLSLVPVFSLIMMVSYLAFLDGDDIEKVCRIGKAWSLKLIGKLPERVATPLSGLIYSVNDTQELAKFPSSKSSEDLNPAPEVRKRKTRRKAG